MANSFIQSFWAYLRRTMFLCLAAVCFIPVSASAELPIDPDTPEQREAISAAMKPSFHDLDEIAERGLLRMVIPYNPIFFAYDGKKMAGLAVERAREFESYLKKRLKRQIDIILIPLPRDQILPAILEGRADIAAANLTITDARKEIVDFSEPLIRNISEQVVTGPLLGKISSFDDLVSGGVFVRASSSYYGHLNALNAVRGETAQQPIPIVAADERLEDYDLLDLVQSGNIPAIIVDSHKLDLWEKVFDGIHVHRDLEVNVGGDIGWAMRKGTPALMEAVNGFVKKVREGSLIGNVLIERYFGSADWISDVHDRTDSPIFQTAEPLIKRYAAQYGLDWKMILAQAYQESKLDQSKRSSAGAIGIMQVLPDTARDKNVAIPNIEEPEANVHAGVKYLNHLREDYYAEDSMAPVDRILFSLAAYNAGPGNINRARSRAKRMGLDPNRWFSNVEIAAARTISREPVIYVRNIYKYFVAFSLLDEESKAEGRKAMLDERKQVALSHGNGRARQSSGFEHLSSSFALGAAGGLALLIVAVYLWQQRGRKSP